MKYMMRIIMSFEKDNDTEAMEYGRELIESNIENNCAIEIIRIGEEKEFTEEQSFQDLLANLNSNDMTKN